jgi:HEPN domain-containing protein
LITLLEAKIPDPAIEKRLCNDLYQVFRDSADFRRQEILSALEEHGSTDCIDDLETIKYQVDPGFSTIKLSREAGATPQDIGPQDDPNDILHAATHEADFAFGEHIRIAIQSIKNHGKPPLSDWSTAGPIEDPFARAKWYTERAEQHIAGKDFGASLNYCRKALEALLKSFIKLRGLKVKTDEPIDKLELKTLLPVINSQVEMPKDIRMHMEAVQKDSTYGSHDQGVVPEEVLTAAIARAAIDKYRQVEVFLTNYGQRAEALIVAARI